MTLFLITWKIFDDKRDACMTYFGSMSKEDDDKETDGVELLGRWSDIGTGTGAAICRADKYVNVASWIYNWVPMANCSIKPICDDNIARKILLNKKPKYTVDYSQVSREPLEGETFYMITYKFHEQHKLKGYKTFARLSEKQDKLDCGSCIPVGRWHDIGSGSGIAIAGAKSEAHIYEWASHWTGICDCSIVPVLTDTQCRLVISSKPDFDKKLSELTANN